MKFDFTLTVEAILGLVTMTTAIVLWGLRRRRSKHEAAQAAKAQAELVKTEQEAHAPFWEPSNARVNVVFDEVEPGRIGFYSAAHGNLLWAGRQEVSELMPAGNEVIFLIKNSGGSARLGVVELDGKPIALRREPELKDAHGLQFLAYPFDPAMRGKPQNLRFTFKPFSGPKDTHVYQTRHGCRVLVRVQPPLLEQQRE